MKLSKKYFRIRITLIMAITLTIFSAVMSYILFTDYSIPKEDLNKSELIIDKLYHTTYIQKRSLKPDRISKCFEIRVKDKPYFIRLSDDFHIEKWDEIKEQFSNGDTLRVIYAKHLLQDSILHNPNEVLINSTTIISFDERKRIYFYSFLALICLILVSGFLSRIAYKTYKVEHLKEDKTLFKKSKLKLINRWISE